MVALSEAIFNVTLELTAVRALTQELQVQRNTNASSSQMLTGARHQMATELANYRESSVKAQRIYPNPIDSIQSINSLTSTTTALRRCSTKVKKLLRDIAMRIEIHNEAQRPPIVAQSGSKNEILEEKNVFIKRCFRGFYRPRNGASPHTMPSWNFLCSEC